MDVDVQAELTRLRSQFPELDWSYCVDDNGTLVPPTWPPEVPLAAPPLRSKPPPATNVQRRGGGHGKTRDMCYVSCATTMPLTTALRGLSACIDTLSTKAARPATASSRSRGRARRPPSPAASRPPPTSTRTPPTVFRAPVITTCPSARWPRRPVARNTLSARGGGTTSRRPSTLSLPTPTFQAQALTS